MQVIRPVHGENPDRWQQGALLNLSTTYESPLRSYPLLVSRSRPMHLTGLPESSSMASSSRSSSSLPSILSPFFFPSSSSISSPSHSSSEVTSSPQLTLSGLDLGPLKLATASKMLDPMKRICRYEVPGGGVCRDAGCEDTHLGGISGQRGEGPSGA